MSLLITTVPDEHGLLVHVEGEVDVSNAPQLRSALDEALAQTVGLENPQVTVDLSAVPYIDSTGIGVLVGTVHRASEQNVKVVVARPQRNVARVLGLLGLDDELGVVDVQQ